MRPSGSTGDYSSAIDGGITHFFESTNAFLTQYLPYISAGTSPSFTITERGHRGNFLTIEMETTDLRIGETILEAPATLSFYINERETLELVDGWHHAVSLSEISLSNYAQSISLNAISFEGNTLPTLAVYNLPISNVRFSPLGRIISILNGIQNTGLAILSTIPDPSPFGTGFPDGAPGLYVESMDGVDADRSVISVYFDNGGGTSSNIQINFIISSGNDDIVWKTGPIRGRPVLYTLISTIFGPNFRDCYIDPFVAYLSRDYDFAGSPTTREGHARFDEWLVHHLLGEAYSGTHYGNTASLHSRLGEALELLGLTDGVDFDLSDLDQILLTKKAQQTVLRWFILYVFNAGNYEGSGLSFEQWVRSPDGLNNPTWDISDLAEAGQDLLFNAFLEWATTPGAGYIIPRVSDILDL